MDCLTIEIIMFLQTEDYVNCSANTVVVLTTLCIVQFLSNLCLLSAWLAAEELDLWSVPGRSVFLDY